MKKPDKRETANLFFSAFLIIAFIVCAHFFTDFTKSLPSVLGSVITILIYAIFGLLLFYATRVGDGKSVKRFSVTTLIVLVLPTLYIMVASVASGMPLHSFFVTAAGDTGAIAILAAIAFGYGVPYTFLSGYESQEDNSVEAADAKPVDGGIEADLLSGEVDESDDEAEIEEKIENHPNEDVKENFDSESDPEDEQPETEA